MSFSGNGFIAIRQFKFLSHERCVADLAPHLFRHVSKRRANKRTTKRHLQALGRLRVLQHKVEKYMWRASLLAVNVLPVVLYERPWERSWKSWAYV
jgi:hypothetical protein